MKVFTTALKKMINEVASVFTPTYQSGLQPIKVRVNQNRKR